MNKLSKFINTKLKCYFQEKILKEMELVSNRVSYLLAEKDAEKFIDDNLWMLGRIEFGKNSDFFIKLTSSLIQDYKMSSLLRKFIENKQEQKVEDSHMNGVIGFALYDIYMALLLHKVLDIPKNMLIGMIILNMKKGNAKQENIIGIIIQNHFILYLQDDKPLNIEVIVNEIIQKSTQALGIKTETSDSSCPFHKSSKKEQWIENIWDYFDNELLVNLHSKSHEIKSLIDSRKD